MDLNREDLSALREVLVGAINDCHRVLAKAADRKMRAAESKTSKPRSAVETQGLRPMAVVASPAPKRFFTIKETAETLGLSRTTIYALIGQNKLKAKKIGRRTLICLADIDALVEAEMKG